MFKERFFYLVLLLIDYKLFENSDYYYIISYFVETEVRKYIFIL